MYPGQERSLATITPEYASILVSNTLSHPKRSWIDKDAGVEIVSHFASLMSSGSWQDLTQTEEGKAHPIWLEEEDGKEYIALGLRRLKACIISGIPLRTWLVIEHKEGLDAPVPWPSHGPIGMKTWNQ